MIKWRSPSTVPVDGTEVIIKTQTGVVSAWFHNEKGYDVDDGYYEWVCFDDTFYIVADGQEPHDVIEGWLPLEGK